MQAAADTPAQRNSIFREGCRTVYDIVEIRKLLPHRYPMLLIDRVLEWEPGKRAVAIKNVTANEHFFQGHYPEVPLMPGVLIVEAMAQAAGVALATSERVGALPVLAGVDGARFRKPVVPGDQLRIEAEVTRGGRRMGKVSALASVEGRVVAQAQLLFTYISKSTFGASGGHTVE